MSIVLIMQEADDSAIDYTLYISLTNSINYGRSVGETCVNGSTSESGGSFTGRLRESFIGGRLDKRRGSEDMGSQEKENYGLSFNSDRTLQVCTPSSSSNRPRGQISQVCQPVEFIPSTPVADTVSAGFGETIGGFYCPSSGNINTI